MKLQIFKLLSSVGKYLSLALFSYLMITQLSQYILPANSFFDSRVYISSYFKFILSISLITLLISASLDYIFGSLKYRFIFNLPNRKVAAYILISLFFSTYYQPELTDLVAYLKFIFFLLTFMLTLPTMISFLLSNKNNSLNHIMPGFDLNKSHLPPLFLKLIFISLFNVLIFFTFLIVANITMFYVDGSLTREQSLMRTLHIKSVKPEKTIHAAKVIVEGYNFGWKNNSDWRLMSETGQINTELWQNNLIEFITPFELPVGRHQIWIEKPSRDSPPNDIIISSNHMSITVLPRFSFYPDVGDNIYIRGIKKVKLYIFEKTNWISDHIF